MIEIIHLLRKFYKNIHEHKTFCRLSAQVSSAVTIPAATKPPLNVDFDGFFLLIFESLTLVDGIFERKYSEINALLPLIVRTTRLPKTDSLFLAFFQVSCLHRLLEMIDFIIRLTEYAKSLPVNLESFETYNVSWLILACFIPKVDGWFRRLAIPIVVRTVADSHRLRFRS